MARKRLRTECCGDDVQTEEGVFHPLVKNLAELDAALAAGQPVYCACCGEELTAEQLAALR